MELNVPIFNFLKPLMINSVEPQVTLNKIKHENNK